MTSDSQFLIALNRLQTVAGDIRPERMHKRGYWNVLNPRWVNLMMHHQRHRKMLDKHLNTRHPINMDEITSKVGVVSAQQMNRQDLRKGLRQGESPEDQKDTIPSYRFKSSNY